MYAMSEETIAIVASNLTVAYFAGHERRRPVDIDSRSGTTSMTMAENAPFEVVIKVFEKFRQYVKEHKDGSTD
jgi:hypothetical protein